LALQALLDGNSGFRKRRASKDLREMAVRCLLPENESITKGRASAELSILDMHSLQQEIPAVS
jgi:hypothetical protein